MLDMKYIYINQTMPSSVVAILVCDCCRHPAAEPLQVTNLH